MHSKKLIRFIYIVSLTYFVLGLSHCSYFFEEKKVELELNFDDQVGGCLSSANLVLSSFFSDEDRSAVVTEANVDRAVECYQEAITSFNANTTSGRSGSREYTPDIFYNFLVEFYPTINLSLTQITEYVKIKGFIIGGQSDTFSKVELEKIHDLLPMLGNLLKKLIPYRGILLQQETLERTPEHYDRFKVAFSEFRSEVGTLLVELDKYKGHRDISMNDFLGFLFEEIFDGDIQDKLNMIPLIIAFKNMAIDDEGENLNRNNFSFFARQALLTYEAVAQFEYFVKGEGEDDIFTNIGHVASFFTRIPSLLISSEQLKTVSLKAVSDLIDIGEIILTYAIRTRSNQKIPYYKFHDLFMALEQANLVNGPLSAPTLSVFVADLSEKWLDPQNQGDASLTQRKVRYIKSIVEEWMQRQEIFNELISLSGAREVSLVDLPNEFTENTAFNNWVNALKRISFHQWNEENRVLFSKQMTQFSYSELTVANSIYLLVEIFMKPYNLDKSNPNEFSVTEAEAQEIYEVLRTLGVEMAFMDSRVYDSGERAYLEGNNFSTQHTNDDKMSFYEGYEYLSVAMNSGQLADKIYEDLPEDCHIQNFPDVHHRNVTDKACFKEFLFRNYGEYFQHLPVINDFWREANNNERHQFLESMEYASRAGVINNNKPYDLGEIRFIVSVTYYLQSIFYLFDRAEPFGIASGDELNVAEEHFRSMIAELILDKRPNLIPDNRDILRGRCSSWVTESPRQLSEEEELRRVDRQISQCLARKLFIHLLRGGGIPSGNFTEMETLSFARLLIEYFETSAYEGTEANVHDVLKVFSALSKVNRESQINSIKTTLIGKRESLIASISSESVPQCLNIAKTLRSHDSGINQAVESNSYPEGLNRNEVFFCYWARKLYCNESVTESVYNYFRDNQRSLFFGQAWDLENKIPAAEQAMSRIYGTFGLHRLFSTQCSFPMIAEETFPDRTREMTPPNNRDRRLDFHLRRLERVRAEQEQAEQ